MLGLSCGWSSLTRLLSYSVLVVATNEVAVGPHSPDC